MSTTIKPAAASTETAPHVNETLPPFTLLGMTITPKVVWEDTGGAYVLMEMAVPPGCGTPPHICHEEDKAIYVLDGEFDILLGNDFRKARDGECVVIPKGTQHNFRNAGAKPGRILVSLNPAGHERFLRELCTLPVGSEEAIRLCQAYGVELVSPA